MLVYVFLRQRPIDAQAWPLVFMDRVLAEMCVDRVSDVVEVTVEVSLTVKEKTE